MQPGVLIYEDNNQLRDSISKLVAYSREHLLLGSFPNALHVEKQVKTLKPDIILMDIDMPGGINGIEAVKKIRTFNQEVHIIMLTVFDDNTNVLDAVFAGASGYLLKKHLSDRLLEAMQEILAGGAPMSPSVARMVINSMHKYPSAGSNIYQLTPRETEILTALSQGSSYKIIAAQSFISVDTVRSHVKNIYQKMQVHSQLEAIARARDAGIV
ncbi:MAG: response regulator transcription factor [Bacteroidota bacterium]|nr:response regulator transcription factor [Bacteroidota bacterium]MDP4216376.1 response regulator transcription factor [Bacteroidota bacterium]MDP4244721.1 response regulator transcription factor [Bacteroidota bacterium]MDP4254176.1 response regulator transcription factor [Bacteroidota bacterium]MDP4258968.1 response regulator transcription factor [Bacteroidota bacterium]